MKKLSVMCLVAAVVVLAGCTKEGKTQTTGANNGVLTVSIASDKTRAEVDDFERNVANFSVYVFNWNTGDLERKETSPDGAAITIQGLNTAGAKRVLVIANGTRTDLPHSFIPQFENNPNYSRLADGYLALEDQMFTDFTDLAKGFLMTGENPTPLQLVAGINRATITVRRVVAKVQLGEITFDNTVQLADLADFDLTAAMIQRAASFSTLGTDAISTPSISEWVGGAEGSITTIVNPLLSKPLDLQTYLGNLYTTSLGYSGLDDATIGETTLGEAMSANALTSVDAFENDVFWYVLPNGDPEKFTLMTLKGSYGGVDYYYPIEINDPDVVGNELADGTYVKRNTVYTINLRFKQFPGEIDPDSPGVAAWLEVTIEPEEWAGPVIQESVW